MQIQNIMVFNVYISDNSNLYAETARRATSSVCKCQSRTYHLSDTVYGPGHPSPSQEQDSEDSAFTFLEWLSPTFMSQEFKNEADPTPSPKTLWLTDGRYLDDIWSEAQKSMTVRAQHACSEPYASKTRRQEMGR